MYNANLYERVIGRGGGIMSATPLNLRQERNKPMFVSITTKIDADFETSNARMPRGDNSKLASAMAAGSSSLGSRWKQQV